VRCLPFLTAQNKSYPIIVRKRRRWFSERQYIYYEGNRTFVALKVPRLGPIVLLVNVACRQGGALVSEDRKVVGSEVFECTAEE
jgi:hypothetical protein